MLLGLWINRSLAEEPLKASFLKAEEAEWLHQRQQRLKVAILTGALSHLCSADSGMPLG